MGIRSADFLDFVIIGAMKAGTTSLYSYLSLHPELSVPYKEKEVNFFNNDTHWNTGISWYAQNFNGKNLKRGEVNPNYAMFPRCQVVPKRLHQFSPNVKIIYILRDPIERLRSHIHHNYIKGLENRSLEEILSDQEDSLRYIAYSRYFYQIEQFLSFFSREQILITTLEELSDKPVLTMNLIFDFLGVEKNVLLESSFEIKHVSSEKVKAGKILKLARKTPLMKTYQSLKPMLSTKTHIRIKRLLGKHFERPGLSENQTTYLKDIFNDDIGKMEELIGKSLSFWDSKYTSHP